MPVCQQWDMLCVILVPLFSVQQGGEPYGSFWIPGVTETLGQFLLFCCAIDVHVVMLKLNLILIFNA